MSIAVPTTRWMYFILFGCVLVEVLELELFESSPFHHVWDAVVLLIYTSSARRISGKSSMLTVMLFVCGVPWTLDLFNFHWAGADVESVFGGCLT